MPPLFFFTDEKRLADPRPVLDYLPAGTGVVFRHYRSADRATLAQDVADLCRRQQRLCLIAADPTLARQVRADGVHWPEGLYRRGVSTHRVNAGRPINWVITTSIHSLPALRQLRPYDLSAAFISPVFATHSHVGGAFLGPLRARSLVRASPVPAYLLGGISNENAGRLSGSGAAGLAAIGALLPC